MTNLARSRQFSVYRAEVPTEVACDAIAVSVVVPVYRAAATVAELTARIESALQAIVDNYEVILVDDGSPDDSWQAVQAEASRNPRVKGLRLSRNFGQHAAITAGLWQSVGNWVIVMDCDLQDRPEEIAPLFERANQGFDIVFARRNQRSDGLLRRLLSKAFFWTLGYLTDTHQDSAIANFGIYHRKVINAILAMDDYVRFFPTMVKWVGFNASELDVQHGRRTDGKTTYTYKSLLDLAINVILSFSDKPLRLTVRFGILTSITAFLFAFLNVYWYFVGTIEVLGFTSLIVSIWGLSGIIITLIGILGLYIGRIFDQTKNRPVYIVAETLNET